MGPTPPPSSDPPTSDPLPPPPDPLDEYSPEEAEELAKLVNRYNTDHKFRNWCSFNLVAHTPKEIQTGNRDEVSSITQDGGR